MTSLYWDKIKRKCHEKKEKREVRTLCWRGAMKFGFWKWLWMALWWKGDVDVEEYSKVGVKIDQKDVRHKKVALFRQRLANDTKPWKLEERDRSLHQIA